MKDKHYIRYIVGIIVVWIIFFAIFIVIDHYFKSQLLQFSASKMVKLQINSKYVFGVQKAMILGR